MGSRGDVLAAADSFLEAMAGFDPELLSGVGLRRGSRKWPLKQRPAKRFVCSPQLVLSPAVLTKSWVSTMVLRGWRARWAARLARPGKP